MKKILFYTPFITIGGGVQKVSIDYIKLLCQKYKLDVVCDFNMGKEISTYEDQIPENVNFKYLKSKRISSLIYFFRTLGKKNPIFNVVLYFLMIIFDFFYYHIKFKDIIKKGEYDYTISFFQFLPAYLTKNKQTKHIIWLHGSVSHFFGGIRDLFKNHYGKKLNKYDFVVTIANEMKEQLIDFYPNLDKNKIKTIYNPFDFTDIINKSNDYSSLNNFEKEMIEDDYICTVSRLDEKQKDITTLINAYENLYNLNKINYKLYIIGDGPNKQDLMTLVKRKKLEHQILFIGKKSNPFVWMKNANLFILSSKYEGFGLVLLEAMICETFVISSNCKTGPAEILNNGTCGDLFEVGNAVELSDKIYFALSNDKYRKSKIELAKKRLIDFQADKSISDFLNLL